MDRGEKTTPSVGVYPYSPNHRSAFWRTLAASILGVLDRLDDRQMRSVPTPNHTTYVVAHLQRTLREDRLADHQLHSQYSCNLQNR